MSSYEKGQNNDRGLRVECKGSQSSLEAISLLEVVLRSLTNLRGDASLGGKPNVGRAVAPPWKYILL